MEGDKEQVAVLELGKDIVRATLPIVKTKSGKAITYQDEEAKKQAGGAQGRCAPAKARRMTSPVRPAI